MTTRIVLGASWALILGLAGGWLMLSPWALSQQPSGRDWTTVTQAEFFTGLGLVVLAVAGLGLITVHTVQGLREAGVIGPRRSAPVGSRGRGSYGRLRSDSEGSSEEFESALVGLAQALTRELQSSPGVRPEGAAGNDQPHARREV